MLLGQEWFKLGMRGKVFAAVTAHGAPLAEEAEWVLRPVGGWAEFLGAKFAGGVSFQGREKGAVARASDVLQRCRELGRKAVEMAEGKE